MSLVSRREAADDLLNGLAVHILAIHFEETIINMNFSAYSCRAVVSLDRFSESELKIENSCGERGERE